MLIVMYILGGIGVLGLLLLCAAVLFVLMNPPGGDHRND